MALARLLLAAALTWLPGSVLAQTDPATWPERPIRWIVTHAAGGASDAICRLVAERLSEILGQRVYVENRAGGATVIGTTEIGRSPPDGYTIGFAADSFAINTAAGTQQIDTNKMIQPVIRLMGYQFMLITNAEKVPMRDFRAMVEHAKKNPEWLTFASLGPNSTHELVFRALERAVGIRSVMVNYRGVGPGLNDLVGGHVMSMLTGVGIADAYISTGKLNAIAVTGTERLPSSPEVPTVKEKGYPDFSFSGWYGVIVPRGIPRPILDRLNAALNTALQSPQVKSRIEALGGEVGGGTIEDFDTIVQSDIARYRSLLPAEPAKAHQ